MGHEYQATIHDRNSDDTQCPICNAKSQTSFPEQAILFYVKKLYPDAISRYMQMVAQNLRILCATRERMRQMEAKQATVEEKIEEIRLVNRAKWLLIECLGMTEPEAHRYIEKQSMDQRISKREAAEAVIKTYK